MYYHIIENTQRNGVKGYRKVNTFRGLGAAQHAIENRGKPAWIINSEESYIPHTTKTLGEIEATRWNSGSGYVVDTMPAMPYLGDQ